MLPALANHFCHFSVRWKILLQFQCRNRLLLTGTPIQNTMAEVSCLCVCKHTNTADVLMAVCLSAVGPAALHHANVV